MVFLKYILINSLEWSFYSVFNDLQGPKNLQLTLACPFLTDPYLLRGSYLSILLSLESANFLFCEFSAQKVEPRQSHSRVS